MSLFGKMGDKVYYWIDTCDGALVKSSSIVGISCDFDHEFKITFSNGDSIEFRDDLGTQFIHESAKSAVSELVKNKKYNKKSIALQRALDPQVHQINAECSFSDGYEIKCNHSYLYDIAVLGMGSYFRLTRKCSLCKEYDFIEVTESNFENMPSDLAQEIYSYYNYRNCE